MALSETAQLLIKVSAQNGASAALNQLHGEFAALKSKILEVGAALGVGLGLKSVISETVQWAQQTRELQTRLGSSAESASRLNYAAQVFGITTDELYTSLGRMSKAMYSTSVEADKGKDVFSKWGISVSDANGKARDVLDVFGQLAGQVQRLGDGSASAALELDILGRSGGRVHELLLQGAAGVQQLVKESDALGLTLNGQGLAAAYNFGIQMNKLGLAFDGLKIALGQAILPMLTALVRALTQFVQWVISAIHGSEQFAGIMKVIGEVFRYVGGLIKSVVENIKTFAAEIGQDGFVGALLALANSLKGVLVGVLSDIGGKIDDIFGKGTLASIVVKALGVALLGLVAGEVIVGLGNIVLNLIRIAAQGAPLMLVATAIVLLAQSAQGGVIGFGEFAIAVVLATTAVTIQFLPAIRTLAAFMAGTMIPVVIEAVNNFRYLAETEGLAAAAGSTLVPVLFATIVPLLLVLSDIVLVTSALITIKDTVDLVVTHWGTFVDALMTGKLDDIPVFGFFFHLIHNALTLIQNVIDKWNELKNLWGAGGDPNAIPGGAPPGSYPPPPGFASGTPMVTRTGLAVIHRGEAIIPAAQNVGGHGSVTNVFNIGSVDSSDRVRELADAVGDALMQSIGHSRSLAF